jgi:spore germination cell wall hydrolase CwlJ-like protein
MNTTPHKLRQKLLVIILSLVSTKVLADDLMNLVYHKPTNNYDSDGLMKLVGKSSYSVVMSKDLPLRNTTNKLSITNQQRNHLVVALFHEARGESLLGKKLVVQTIINRSRLLNKSVSSVIVQPYQFSFVPKGSSIKYLDNEYLRLLRKHSVVMEDLRSVVDYVIDKQPTYHTSNDSRLGITHYTRTEVRRPWMKKSTSTNVVGNHKFMRIKL